MFFLYNITEAFIASAFTQYLSSSLRAGSDMHWIQVQRKGDEVVHLHRLDRIIACRQPVVKKNPLKKVSSLLHPLPA